MLRAQNLDLKMCNIFSIRLYLLNHFPIQFKHFYRSLLYNILYREVRTGEQAKSYLVLFAILLNIYGQVSGT